MNYLEIAKDSLNQLRAETPGSDAARIAAMKLDDFARAGLIVQVRSEVLGADVLFVSDTVPESKIKDRPEVVYRVHELKKLARMPPDPRGLHNVHVVKEIFGGTIQGITDKASGEDLHREVRDRP